MNLYTYFTTNVLGTLTETLGVENHHMDVVVVLVGLAGAVVFASWPRLGLCIAVFRIVPSHEPIQSPCGVFAPR